ncbi:2-oxo acid dehydrogenase subunit E2 [Microbispora sp. NPDC049125]|uniref:2-oxo acid dehydrogenase subunit E2 n=1 Tax=Microbispora sp. NPDC049125 TaxID=3154929 RepID=UPI0034665966
MNGTVTGGLVRPLPPERRPTLHFLRFAGQASPVYIDTDVDSTALLLHRALGRRYSVVSYVLRAAGVVLARYPEANGAFAGSYRPKVAAAAGVHAKLTLDKTLNQVRTVRSAVLPRVDLRTLDQIQDDVDRFRDEDPATLPELRGARMLQRVPYLAGRVMFSLGSTLARRHLVLGTVSVTSLGHRPVRRFFSSGGTAVTLGVGQILDTPVVRDGAVVAAPMMPLSLTFDHRVLDGALAADVLAGLKHTLEDLSELIDPEAEGSSDTGHAAGHVGAARA